MHDARHLNNLGAIRGSRPEGGRMAALQSPENRFNSPESRSAKKPPPGIDPSRPPG